MEDTYRHLSWTQIRIVRMHHRIIDGRIQQLGIHPSQNIVLMHLRQMGRMASQVQIADQLDVSPACVARTLKTLETGGYIERSDCSTDGRRNEINITEKGERIVQQSRAVLDHVDSMAFKGFSESELETLQGLLDRMRSNLADAERSERGTVKELNEA